MPDETGEPVVNYTRVPTFCTRGCGCIGHPAFPAPSCQSRAFIFRKPGRYRAAGMPLYVLRCHAPRRRGVRRGLTAQIPLPLEYWIARSRLRQGSDEATFSWARRSFSEGGKPGDDGGENGAMTLPSVVPANAETHNYRRTLLTAAVSNNATMRLRVLACART